MKNSTKYLLKEEKNPRNIQFTFKKEQLNKKGANTPSEKVKKFRNSISNFNIDEEKRILNGILAKIFPKEKLSQIKNNNNASKTGDKLFNMVINNENEKNRIKPLNLCLIKDTIKEQENKKKVKNVNLDEIMEELYNKNIAGKNGMNKIRHLKKIRPKLDKDDIDYLSRKSEKELNLTNRQMNILNNEADLLYNGYNRNFSINKDTLLKNSFNNRKNNIFFCKLGVNIVNKYTFNNKNRNKNKIELKVPVMPFILRKYGGKKVSIYNSEGGQPKNFFSPSDNNHLNLLKKYNNNICILSQKKLSHNYSDVLEGRISKKKYLEKLNF